MNFQITVLIAAFVGGVLVFVVIGAFPLLVLGIVDVVFCIVAAIAASNGGAYRYPVTSRLIK
ncbi:MAG: DUF4870 domain-containing protein [Zoogloeaceae bacterium]|nr:DUF4870 domain-containing protein [Zoogloeaceae bacterium]